MGFFGVSTLLWLGGSRCLGAFAFDPSELIYLRPPYLSPGTLLIFNIYISKKQGVQSAMLVKSHENKLFSHL